jgi:Xaa-Pro aminopeptidase
VSRIALLAEKLDDPFLVTSGVNVRYLTNGFRSSNAALLVAPDGAATLYADFRYAERGRAVEDVTFREVPRDLVAGLAELLAGQRIGFEESHLTFAGHRTLHDAGIELQPTAGLVESLRAVKEDGEVEAMRRAAALSDEVFAAFVDEPVLGRTEGELVWWFERSFREGGAESVAFSTIVAAGSTGASPHATPGDRVVERGALLTIDAGCVVDGYCSDCTRTFSTGDLPDRLVEIYELCLETQLAGLAAVRPGVSGRDADAAARERIESAGFGESFGHGLGHGVGIEVHEAPVLRPESKDVLQAGNTVTVEPGIYLSGVGGVRIEDLVLVVPDGCERLTQFPKELQTVS